MVKRLLVALVLLLPSLCSEAADGKIIKVLPHYLDLEGRHALSPSLYDRDAYQAQLRQHPEQRSAVRFDVQWKSREPQALKFKVEMRGARGKDTTSAVVEVAKTSRGPFSHWSSLTLSGEAYKKLGELTAWRVTLWDGDRLISEQKSFLW